MNLKKCLKEFYGFKVGDVIMDLSYCHNCPVKVGDSKNKTTYRWDLLNTNDWTFSKWKQLEEDGFVRDLKKWEVVKISHHMTWRIWRNVGSKLNSTGQQGFSFDVLNEKKIKGNKPRLLPTKMCFDCMKEGNEFMPKKPFIVEVGKCRVCDNIKPLHLTQYAYPLDLTKYGFGFTIGPYNMPSNKAYYEKNYQIEEWD